MFSGLLTCTEENANSEEASWKVAWWTEHFCLRPLKWSENYLSLNEADPGPYFLVWRGAHENIIALL